MLVAYEAVSANDKDFHVEITCLRSELNPGWRFFELCAKERWLTDYIRLRWGNYR